MKLIVSLLCLACAKKLSLRSKATQKKACQNRTAEPSQAQSEGLETVPSCKDMRSDPETARSSVISVIYIKYVYVIYL